MNLFGYYFEKDYPLHNTTFNDVAGIYIIYTSSGKVLDIGETDTLKTRLQNHERKPSWILHAGTESIFVGFHAETNSAIRLVKEKNLRQNLNPICGEK